MRGSRSRTVWLLLSALSLLAFTRQAYAFCFAPQLQVSDEYFISDFVITGTVVSNRYEKDPQDPDSLTGTFYTIRVVKTWHGKAPESLTLYSENSTARFPMRVDGTYILFVTKSDNGKWIIDNCGNSGLLPSANKVLSALRALPLRQSFIYGDVYQSWKTENAPCPPMQLRFESSQWRGNTNVRSDCKFRLNVPPGSYRATLYRKSTAVPSNDLNYKDPYCFEVPMGGSAGIAFRIADGADALNLAMVVKDDQHYRDLCSKPQRSESPAGIYVLTHP
jgi:hypothetical protein